MSLLARALAYNLDAHRANPANLVAGALGMIINNVLLLLGMWGMLFAGKPANDSLLPYYLALNAVVMVSWGFVNFFLGGLRSLGDLITEGALEPWLATPRDPLWLAAISRSFPVALGDLVMGLAGFVGLGIWLDAGVAARCLAAAAISTLACMGLFVAAGAIAFFVPRGNAVGTLLIEATLSLSCYPTGKMFAGGGRIVLLMTPAAALAVLPVEAVESATAGAFAAALAAAGGLFAAAVWLFRRGLRRYRALSLIGARR